MALVSVVMPAFQAQSTLGAAISGVLTQTHPDVELLVVDDGSSDATSAIAQAHGPRVTAIRQRNAGTAAARNAALSQARGDFIAFCDADDVLLPRHLERALDAYRRASASDYRWIVTSEALLLTEQGVAHGRRLLRGKIPPPDRQERSIVEDNFVGVLSLFPRALIEEIGVFDTEVRRNEDWHFWMRAVLSGWRVVLQDEPQALYRFTPGAKSERPPGQAEQMAIIDRALAQLDSPLPAELSGVVERRRRVGSPRILDALGNAALRRGDDRAARQHFRDVLRTQTQDSRLRRKAMVVGWVPGMTRIEAARQRRIGARAGSRRSDAGSTSA